MKRKSMFLMLTLSLTAAVMGCGQVQTPSAGVLLEESSVTEEKEDTEEAKSEPVESEWEASAPEKQSFPVNFAAFHTKDFGLTVGMGGEIHYTTDGGVSWLDSENHSNCCFGVDFVDENVIYVSGNGMHVVKSTDGGQSFLRVEDFGGSTPNQCKMLSFCDENNGIIASSKKMAITNDGAASWKELTLPCEVVGIQMTSPEQLYFVGKDFCMYTSEDAGETWSFTDLKLPEQTDYYNIPQAVAFTVDETGYTIFATQKSTKLLKNYVTADNGETWTECPLPEVTGHYNLYLNHTGDILTANDGLKLTAVKLVHK